LYDYEKKVQTVIVSDSNNINKTNNPPLTSKHWTWKRS